MKPNLKTYQIGFVISIILTLGAFFVVSRNLFDRGEMISIILGLAVAQLVVQLVFFLHIGLGKTSSWNLFAFVSTMGIVLIILVASLWIMYNLNNNHMLTGEDANHYILQQENILR